ncbi:hypothetical protein BSK59_13250 [Paenibacillus odorifer]|uniref:hypothetical protein n=1 Tax=Paenibacillus odorifer TaxID=189426 RepID=UPI00096CDE85|nr:hypothetical protein [Paenibacillus odorifer]OME55438.1 hypothetical protein BSK59_13250 [Paenibacillus odorifer]
MIFNCGNLVYSMPIRFWEDKTPIKCIVELEKKTSEVNLNISSKESIYVNSELYNHNVYVDRRKCFFDEEKCREAIELYSQLHNLYFNDESDEIIKRIFIKDKFKG